jgi:hypothetical protein
VESREYSGDSRAFIAAHELRCGELRRGLVDESIFSWEEATCCSVALNFFCIAILKRETGGLFASYRNGEFCRLGVEEPSSQPGGPKVGCCTCSLTKLADPGIVAASGALSFFRRHLHTLRGLQPLHATRYTCHYS